MTISNAKYLLVLLALSPILGAIDCAADSLSSKRGSVVKIYVTIQHEDYTMPWQGGEPAGGTGTGFIIKKNRILTNAHVVSDHKFIEVQRYDEARRYEARVLFIGHDCDLAVLTVDDPGFFEDIRPVKLADSLPSLNDEVMVLGYPLGGDRLSVTKGVVSRIDYGLYTHSEIDQHLVLQVDAAINPGNSGGPVLFNGKVVGLAFQGLAWAENIGYAIPLPVIEHFLKDIEDDVYNGYPELGLMFMTTRNAALRRDLNMPDGKSGIVVQYVDPFGSAKGFLMERDVLLSIDSHQIADDATVDLGGNVVLFAELLERKQWGEAVTFAIWRNNSELEVKVPLTNPSDPFVYRRIYDERPKYYMAGGLVFAPLSREYLQTPHKKNVGNSRQIFYYAQYAKIDGFYKDRDEFVVLIGRLPHSVNTYCDSFVNGIVTNVNGLAIHNLKDVKTAVTGNKEDFHVLYFAAMNDSLVMDANAMKRADPEISARYGIPLREHLGEK